MIYKKTLLIRLKFSRHRLTSHIFVGIFTFEQILVERVFPFSCLHAIHLEANRRHFIGKMMIMIFRQKTTKQELDCFDKHVSDEIQRMWPAGLVVFHDKFIAQVAPYLTRVVFYLLVNCSGHWGFVSIENDMQLYQRQILTAIIYSYIVILYYMEHLREHGDQHVDEENIANEHVEHDEQIGENLFADCGTIEAVPEVDVVVDEVPFVRSLQQADELSKHRLAFNRIGGRVICVELVGK